MDADTEVEMADGTRKRIADIRVGASIVSFNEVTGQMEFDRVSQKWDSGRKACIRITTRTGRTVTLTPEHKVRTFDGWVRAEEISEGDRIASPRRVIARVKGGRCDAEVKLLAYMLAEGATSSGNCNFTNADTEIVEDFTASANAMGFQVNYITRHRYDLMGAARAWVRKMGMAGCTALTKRVPSWVFSLPERQKWLFLAAFIDTDGYVDSERMGIDLANAGLIQDISALFAHVGVVSSVYVQENAHAGVWKLHVDKAALGLCLEKMPLILKKSRLVRLCQKHKYSLIDTYPPEVCRDLPFGLNRAIRNAGISRLGTKYDVTRNKLQRAIDFEPLPQWVWLENADVFWDKVTKIEDAGERETFDVEVERNHNLITGGLVTHNSTSTEAVVADLAIRDARVYCLYVCSTQDQADKHVATIARMLESDDVARYAPTIGQPKISSNGNRSWNRKMVTTATGFTVEAIGLDKAVRGQKIDWARPDLIVFDDIDEKHDSELTTTKKEEIITDSIIPAGATNCAVLFVQNLIHSNSVASRLAKSPNALGAAHYLMNRTVSGPFAAVDGLRYEQQEFEGLWRWVIVAGTSLWNGYDLAICEDELNRVGPASYERESQNDVDSDNPNALMSAEDFERTRVHEHPDLVRVAVAVDPPGGATECGIVVVGKAKVGKDFHGYTLEDATVAAGVKPEVWALEILKCYYRHQADAIFVERNYGGDMVTAVIRQTKWIVDGVVLVDGAKVKIVEVVATRGKAVRAEPVAVVFQQGRGHHVGYFPPLEKEWRQFQPGDKDSPNRLDAEVWAYIGLELTGMNQLPTNINLGGLTQQSKWNN